MKISITNLALEDRPREKFMQCGANGLSKAELLAILIGSGNREENAVQLMQRILNDCNGSLATLGRMSIQELCQYKGMGEAKAVSLLASCALANRRMSEDIERKAITSSTDIFNYFCPKMRDLPHEEMHVLLLDQSLHVISSKLISKGGITGTIVDVRIILKEALLANAPNIAVSHNHPSGNVHPSKDDNTITEKIKKASQTIDIHLIDHVIVTNKDYYSYADEGML